MITQDYWGLKKGQFFTPLKVGFFYPNEPEKLTAILRSNDGVLIELPEELFDIKIRKSSHK